MTRLFVLAIAACFQPSFQPGGPCFEGSCPTAGQQCLHDVCVPTGCAGEVDGQACANTSVPDGVCLAGGCVPIGCGDGVIEGDEVCDDGNLVSGDGCSGDCKSTEVCGNGIVDAIEEGEQCDDNDPAGLSGDGCSSRCTVEVLDWRTIPSQGITGRFGMGMAFDLRRGRMVMFGGARSFNDGDFTAETWEYDGTNWFIRAPLGDSPGGKQPIAWYDRFVGRVVGPGLYDGMRWGPAPAAPACAPTSTFDPTRGAMVCFDGTSTWTYDGT